MATVRYSPDHRGIAELAKSPGVGDACVEAAIVGMEAAQSEAESFAQTGQYAASFRVERATVTVPGRNPGSRAGARLVNDAPYAATVEWQDGHHVLAHTVDVIEGA